MNTEKNLQESTEQVLTIPDVRQRFLSLCQKQADWDSYDKPSEETEFYRVCHDGLDFVELIMNCEKEFSIKIDETSKEEYSFDTVKDFIDWASLNVA
jgi:acyl carrier protein